MLSKSKIENQDILQLDISNCSLTEIFIKQASNAWFGCDEQMKLVFQGWMMILASWYCFLHAKKHRMVPGQLERTTFILTFPKSTSSSFLIFATNIACILVTCSVPTAMRQYGRRIMRFVLLSF